MNELITQFDAGMHYTGEVQGSALSGTWHPEQWLLDDLTWGQSDSGERVNPVTALSHGPVWQAVNIIAGDVSQLPLHVMKRTDDRKHIRQDAHPVEWLLAHEPNEFQTPSVWKEWTMATALLWGNSCSWILRDGAGRPSMLWPLMPDRTSPQLYRFQDERGPYQEWWIETDLGDGKKFPIPYSDIFHVRGLSHDGFWGLSVVDVAKQVIATGLALRKHGNRTFKNSARPAGALENPGKQPPPEVRAQYRQEIEAMHSGSENAGRWLFLWGGTKFTPMSMSNSDAQWLEAKDFDREEVASLFNLPPYKLGAMKNAAVRANVEQQALEYVNGTLNKPLLRIKEEIHRKMFSFGERRLMRLYAEWDLTDLLRGDMAAQAAFFASGITNEYLTKNEVRVDWLGLDAMPGGDELKNPAINPAEKKEPEKKAEPPSEAKEAAKDLVSHQVIALLDAEARAVEKACSGGGNVVRWAENYYESYQRAASHFLERTCKVASATGLGACDWRRASAEHARESLNRLLAMSGIATTDGLAQMGRDFAETTRDQRERFLHSILGR